MRPTARAQLPRLILFVLLLLHLVAVAAAQPAASGWREVTAPGVSVLFEEPELEPFAQRVASLSVEALEHLAELFHTEPPAVSITLDGRTDLYTAIAPPLPRPAVSLPALFPALPEISLRSRDPLYQLLLHELTHTVQLTYLERPPGVPLLPRLGLVGETVAPLPPGWLLEGLAVWAAETLDAQPVRLPAGSWDARARGVLAALAVEGEWPTLADVSLLSHAEWPGNEARYLLGGAFVAELAERYGWETLLSSLREMNAGWYLRPFSEAWRKVTGDELEGVWWSWSEEVREEALRRSERRSETSRPLTKGGRASTVLALEPGGRRVAWRPAGGGLALSQVGANGLERGERLLSTEFSPLSLAWLDNQKLIYSRLAPGADDRFVDLFEFDISSGREVRLTWGERARFPKVGPEGCIWYVRDVVGEGSSLKRLCGPAEPELIFTASAGLHLVGLAVSSAGRVALSVWDAGRVDLALVEEGRLAWLTQDQDQDLDPEWSDAGELLFRSDRGAVFELYSIRPDTLELRLVSPALGGTFSPDAEGQTVVFARLGGQGYDLAAADLDQSAGTPASESPPVEIAGQREQSAETAPRVEYPVRDYRPGASLAPFGWLPEVTVVSAAPLTLAASATVFGQDLSGDHSYSVQLGYDPRSTGARGGGWGRLRYDYRAIDLFDLFQRPPPFGFGMQIGAWPHTPHLSATSEIALGALAEVRARDHFNGWTGAARLRGGALQLPSYRGLQFDGRLDLVASRRINDLWGYGVRGPRISLHLIWSADHLGGAPAAWLDASTIVPPGEIPLTTLLGLRAGWRAPLPATPRLDGFTSSAMLGGRKSIPVGWRYADGIVALERLSVEGRLHAWHDDSVRAGFELSLWGDALLRYGAPLSLGASAGHSGDWWYRLGLRLPL